MHCPDGVYGGDDDDPVPCYLSTFTMSDASETRAPVMEIKIVVEVPMAEFLAFTELGST